MANLPNYSYISFQFIPCLQFHIHLSTTYSGKKRAFTASCMLKLTDVHNLDQLIRELFIQTETLNISPMDKKKCRGRC